jgi:hypothetical protein
MTFDNGLALVAENSDSSSSYSYYSNYEYYYINKKGEKVMSFEL